MLSSTSGASRRSSVDATAGAGPSTAAPTAVGRSMSTAEGPLAPWDKGWQTDPSRRTRVLLTGPSLVPEDPTPLPAPLTRPTPLGVSAIHGHLGNLETALARHAPPDDSGVPGRTVLALALASSAPSRLDIVRRLLVARASLGDSGTSPLHQAIVDGDDRAFDGLLDAGMATQAADAEGTRPLAIAVMCGNVHAVERLVGCGSVDHANEDGRRALDEAIDRSDAGMLDRLVDAGASLHREGIRHPTHRAATVADVATLERLLARGAAVDGDTGSTHDTPLMAAVRRDDAAIVGVLARHGADLRATNLTGTSVVAQAFSRGRDDVVLELIRADPALVGRLRSKHDLELAFRAAFGNREFAAARRAYEAMKSRPDTAVTVDALVRDAARAAIAAGRNEVMDVAMAPYPDGLAVRPSRAMLDAAVRSDNDAALHRLLRDPALRFVGDPGDAEPSRDDVVGGALEVAAARGNDRALTVLLAQGPSGARRTAALRAAQRGGPRGRAATKRLLSSLAEDGPLTDEMREAETSNPSWEPAPPGPATDPVHPLLAFARTGVAPAQAVLDAQSPDNERDAAGIHLLTIAAHHGHLGAVDHFMSRRPPPLDAVAAVVRAATQGHEAVLMRLVRGTSDADRIDPAGTLPTGISALSVAAEGGRTGVLMALLTIDSVRNDGPSLARALRIAAARGRGEFVSMLLHAGAPVAQATKLLRQIDGRSATEPRAYSEEVEQALREGVEWRASRAGGLMNRLFG